MSLGDYINDKPVIETQRLRLRPLAASDEQALREWTPDKSIYAYWGKGPSKADKAPSLLFLSPPKPTKSFHWGVEYIADKKVVGELWVYLIENDRMAKVAYRVSPKYQGRGLATEALAAAVKFCFENTELLRLWSGADARNAASCRVMEKCGFTREGLVRQGKLGSSWRDYRLYGILKEDFLAAKKG